MTSTLYTKKLERNDFRINIYSKEAFIGMLAAFSFLLQIDFLQKNSTEVKPY